MIFEFLSWYEDAACAGMGHQEFFPEQGRTHLGKTMCVTCPVQQECLEHAMRQPYDTFGIWGGMTHKERIQLHRNRQKRGVA